MEFKARRIKFRVYDRCHKSCHIVGENQHDSMNCDWPDNEIYYLNYQNGEGSITYDESLPEDDSGYILMQFTGVKDRNGIEMYEGDILRREGIAEDIIGEIVWSDIGFTGFFLKVKSKDGHSYYPISRGKHDDDDGELCNDIVLGNIYKNPELLQYD